MARTSTLAQIDREQKHQQWKSGMVYPGGNLRFRALTEYTDGSDYIVLTFDRFPSNCSRQYIGMNIILNSPSKSTYTTDQLFGAFRVDEMIIHNINYTISYNAGQPFGILVFTNFDKEETILSELYRGKIFRVKLSTGSNEYYVRFSLSGFTAATTRTLRACMEFNGTENPDKNYFDDNTRVKDDRSYFRY
jgi:hypothetical protein